MENYQHYRQSSTNGSNSSPFESPAPPSSDERREISRLSPDDFSCPLAFVSVAGVTGGTEVAVVLEASKLNPPVGVKEKPALVGQEPAVVAVGPTVEAAGVPPADPNVKSAFGLNENPP